MASGKLDSVWWQQEVLLRVGGMHGDVQAGSSVSFLQVPGLGVRDILKEGNKEARGQEMRRLFGEAVGSKKP